MSDAAIARRALRCLDLTDLTETCSDHGHRRLCAKATDPHGPVAAVCVWPQFVGRAREALKGSPVRIATVVNFPAGGEDVERASSTTCNEALGDGANEIDLVLPYEAVRRGDLAVAPRMVAAVRDVVDQGRLLKVILETGELVAAGADREASRDRHRGGRRLHQDLDRQDAGLRDAGSGRDHARGHQGIRPAGRPQALGRHPHASRMRSLSRTSPTASWARAGRPQNLPHRREQRLRRADRGDRGRRPRRRRRAY